MPLTPEDIARERIEEAVRTGASELNLGGLGLISLPREIGRLTQLKELLIEHNQLTTLPPEIGQLTGLITLNLTRNSLAALPPEISELMCLRQFPLGGNQLTVLPPEIGQLTHLTHLYLDGNQLTSLPPEIGNLMRLEWLYLDGNQLTTLPESLLRLDRLQRLYLHRNRNLGIPPEILGPSWAGVRSRNFNPARPRDILDYYFKTRLQALPLNEVKLLLVGRGKAGKSSIRDQLLFEEFDPHRKETPGIDIRHWPLACGGEYVGVHVWDFAGQEITHATHQFFLTERSVYLLVLDARSDTQDRDAEYWLRLISAFGKESPVLVALNQWEEKPFAIDENSLRERFPAIRAFIPTDCRTRTGIDQLQGELAALLRDWAPVHEPFPEAWWGVKKRLAEPEENYLPFEKYRELCREKGVIDAEEQARLARILHALGVILHYADDARLRDTTVLNPHWVTEGVYRLLRLKDAPGSDGTLTLEEAAGALPGEPREMVAYLIGLMRRFELCYPLDDGETRWLVPQLLPRFQPPLGGEWKAAAATRLRYHYSVVPEGLLPRFIVRTHPLSEGEVRWRAGVVLRLEGASALVRAEPGENRVSVTALGDPEARLRLVKLVRSHFAAMNAEFRGFAPREELEVEGMPGVFKNVEVLELDERQGAATTVDTAAGSKPVDRTAELNRISAPKARDPKQPRVRIFLSYSHGDSALRDIFRANLDIISQDGLATPWFDGLIAPSTEWNQEIRREIEEADIIVLMVSSHFLSRPYIRGVELATAAKRRAAGEAEIGIVLLEPDTSWKTKRSVVALGGGEQVEIDLGKYQALLPEAKTVRDFGSRKIGFNKVEQALRKLIAQVLAKRAGAPARSP